MSDLVESVNVVLPIKILGIDLSLTNSACAMLIVTAAIICVLMLCTRKLEVKPRKAQFFVEKLFYFIGSIVGQKLKNQSIAFFPYILTLFLFIAFGNIFGVFPFGFSFTSQFIVTITMACLIFICSIIIGVANYGVHYFEHFCPSELPGYIKPLFVVIELMSFLFRPISLGIRLFANMFSGHIMLKIIAGFAVTLSTTSFPSVAILPIIIDVLLDIFKLVVCVLQSYVFVVLSCEYLSESCTIGHSKL